MIKNRNIQMGLLVFLITLIGLIAFAELYPENNLERIEKQSVKTDINKQDKLEIAIN
ncbi:MAG: hypothetical protein L3J25_02850 [Flavobacteriaceae bacterium]|nr:hypothetical protein [Flavobacteriaceae bacterium]